MRIILIKLYTDLIIKKNLHFLYFFLWLYFVHEELWDWNTLCIQCWRSHLDYKLRYFVVYKWVQTSFYKLVFVLAKGVEDSLQTDYKKLHGLIFWIGLLSWALQVGLWGLDFSGWALGFSFRGYALQVGLSASPLTVGCVYLQGTPMPK